MATLVCTTPSSPVTQVLNAKLGEYEPDRRLTPTAIHPDVVANASDGSWPVHQVNTLLADIKWLVNGVDISTIAAWQGLYRISLEGETRGDITINKNITPNESVELVFEATLPDNRFGINIPIRTEAITLSTTDKSEDSYSLEIGEDQVIKYNPFNDVLHRYEYKVSHGMQEENDNYLELAKDDINSYLRTIPVNLYQGKEMMSTEMYSIKLYQITGVVNGIAKLKELSTDNTEEIEEVTGDAVKIDMRLIDKRDYLVRAFVDNKVVAEKQFSVNRVYPKFTIRPTNGTSIGVNDTERYDIAMVDCEGNIVDVPESIIKIIWKTDTQALTNIIHGEGADIVIQLINTGVGNTYNDDWIDVYCEGEQKEVMSVAVEPDGTEWTDEEGNNYIFN